MTKKPLSLTSPKQRQGGKYEQLALKFLTTQGLECVAKNWLAPKIGELDLVMLEYGKAWNTLVFVEVRQRKVSIYGDAVMSITQSKKNKIIRAARYFLKSHPQYTDIECRFDIIAYDLTDTLHCNASPEWIQGAFITQAWGSL